MKTLKLMIISVCLFLQVQINAQTKNTDHVFLLNKQNYIGTLVEQKPGEYIKLQLQNTNDTLKFLMDDIEKIVKIKAEENSGSSHGKGETTPGKKIIKTQKMYNQRPISLMVHYGVGAGDISFTDIGLGLYWKLGSRSKVGLSASYFGETGNRENSLLQWQKIPVMTEFTHDLYQYSNNRFALISRLGIGYSFTLNGDYFDPEKSLSFTQSNGLAFNLGLGYRFNIFKNAGILVDINYSLITDYNESVEKTDKSKNLWDNVVFRTSLFF
jgi:hypothetical protein